MSNIDKQLAVISKNLPARANRQSRVAELLANLETGQRFKRISTEGQKFTILDGREPISDSNYVKAPGPIYVVILNHSERGNRVFYKTKWKPGQEKTAPDCSSDDGIVPRVGVKDPQSKTCATCPNAVYGSATNPDGSATFACRRRWNLAVAIAGSEEELTREEPLVAQLSVPPGSVSNLRNYLQKVARAGADYVDLITAVNIDNNEMSFSPEAALSDVEAAAVDRILDEQSDLLQTLVSGKVLEEEVAEDKAARAAHKAAEDEDQRPQNEQRGRRAAPAAKKEEVVEAPARGRRGAKEEVVEAPARGRRGAGQPSVFEEEAPPKVERVARKQAVVEDPEDDLPADTNVLGDDDDKWD